MTDDLLERDIQKTVFKHYRARKAAGVLMFHPKNASSDHAGKHRAQLSVANGVLPGIPDILASRVLFGPPGDATCRNFALELKRESRRGKKETEHEAKQRECREEMEKAGWITGLAYGLDEAIEWLESHGLLKGKSR